MVWRVPSTRCLADSVLNKANVSGLRTASRGSRARPSGAPLPDALAGAPHFPVQFHHFHDGFLSATAHVVKRAIMLLREAV